MYFLLSLSLSRTLWICVPENKSSTRCSSPSASSMLVLRSAANFVHKGGTITTPSALETSPSQQISCTTTWRPMSKYLKYIYIYNSLFSFLFISYSSFCIDLNKILIYNNNGVGSDTGMLNYSTVSLITY